MTAPPPAPPLRPARTPPRNLILGGSIALGVAPFLPWADVFLLGHLNLFELLRLAGRPVIYAWAAVGLGGVIAYLVLTKDTTTARQTAIPVASITGVLVLLFYLGLLHEVRRADGFARVSYGPLVALLGCAAMVVGSLMTRAKPRFP